MWSYTYYMYIFFLSFFLSLFLLLQKCWQITFWQLANHKNKIFWNKTKKNKTQNRTTTLACHEHAKINILLFWKNIFFLALMFFLFFFPSANYFDTFFFIIYLWKKQNLFAIDNENCYSDANNYIETESKFGIVNFDCETISNWRETEVVIWLFYYQTWLPAVKCNV